MSCLRRDSACIVRRTDHLSAAAASNTGMFTHSNEFCVRSWDFRFPMTLPMSGNRFVFLQNAHTHAGKKRGVN